MTESILLPLLAIAVGIAGLVWSANKFVDGAVALAKDLGVSPLVIGLTVVSIGTSAPEILVAASAALQGSSELAVGNALGSNLANIGLVLGSTLLISPIIVRKQLLKQDIPMLVAITLIAGVVLFNNYLGRLESWGLLILFVVFLVFSVWFNKSHPQHDDPEIPEVDPQSLPRAAIRTLFGLTLLVLFSNLLVWGATQTAQAFGVSDLVIGLTIVAVGTSLPELAASIASALKGHAEIAIGNVIGSNVFNLLTVLPVAGIIQASALPSETFSRDYLSMLGLTLLFVVVLIAKQASNPSAEQIRIPRVAGLLFILPYAAYYLLLS